MDESPKTNLPIKKMRFTVWDQISKEAKDFIKRIFKPARKRLSIFEAVKHVWILSENML